MNLEVRRDLAPLADLLEDPVERGLVHHDEPLGPPGRPLGPPDLIEADLGLLGVVQERDADLGRTTALAAKPGIHPGDRLRLEHVKPIDLEPALAKVGDLSLEIQDDRLARVGDSVVGHQRLRSVA